MTRLSLLVLAFLSVCFTTTLAGPPRLLRRPNEVVAFVGGTNIVNLQKSGYFEATVTLANRATRPRFRDLSWEGDTVFRQGTVIERWRRAKFGDLAQQLDAHSITTVIVQFGQSEALQGTIKLGEFVDAYDELISILKSNKRDVVIVSPIPFEKKQAPLPDLSSRNQDLEQYVFAIEQLAGDRDCLFVNLFAEYHNIRQQPLTENGLHVAPAAQPVIAESIARRLSFQPMDESAIMQLRPAVIAKHRLWMDYWRPANWKCLYGDDGRREFGKASAGGMTLREEWQQLPAMIEEAEEQIFQLAEQICEERSK